MSDDEASDIEEEERPFFALFAVLRSEVARVSHNFGLRVSERVEDAARAVGDAPPAGSVMTSVLVEALNMLASALGAKKANEGDDHGK